MTGRAAQVVVGLTAAQAAALVSAAVRGVDEWEGDVWQRNGGRVNTANRAIAACVDAIYAAADTTTTTTTGAPVRRRRRECVGQQPIPQIG